MNLVWCMIALALTGTDDPTPTQTPQLSSPPAVDSPKEVWPLKLHDAIWISLDNSEIVRVINVGPYDIPVGNCFGEPATTHWSPPTMAVDLASGYKPENSSIVISPIKNDVSISRFKSELMAHVRSAEQTYWNLAAAHAALWGAEQAVRLAQEVVKNEQGELVVCRAGWPDLAQATQRLEQFQQERVKRKVDVADNERRLRFILGLPATDNRQIVPVTPPIDLHVVFDWNTCLDNLMQHHPDITQQRVATGLAELQLVIARNPDLPQVTLAQLNAIGKLHDTPDDLLVKYYHKLFEAAASPPPKTGKLPTSKSYVVAEDETELFKWLIEQPDQRPVADVSQAQSAILRSRAAQQQVVDKAKQTLARIYPQVEAGHQQYTAARRSRVADYHKLRSQQRYYNEGRITADRYLDAIGQFATSVTAEHQYLATYNIMLAALSECEGTLLADRNITVVRPARPTEPAQLTGRVKDDKATQASFVGPMPVVDEAAILAKWRAALAQVPKPDAAPVPDATLSETCRSTCGAAAAGLARDAKPEFEEIWPMTLQEAIAVALDSSEIVRVISLGDRGISNVGCGFDTVPKPPPRPPLPAGVPVGVKNDGRSFVVARLNADASSFRFKSEVMALVRSVEQQYWTLAQAHASLWAADRAVNLAHDVVKEGLDTVMASGCTAGMLDLAEASDHVKRLEHDLTERTADVISTEQTLRNSLGVPDSDTRRVLPVTPPARAPFEPDWDTCLDEMMQQQPDVVQQKVLTRLAELQLVIARNPGLPQVSLNALYQMNALGQILDSPEETLMSTFLDGFDVISPRKLKVFKKNRARTSYDAEDILELVGREAGEPRQKPLADVRQARHTFLRSGAFLKRVIHQTTHSLARGFLEVDAGYRCCAKATRLRNAAEQRLETQRAYWEDGRITTDRFLDAVEQWGTLVANEHHYLADYNSAIAVLSECKGTLLADHDIIVAEPRRRDNGKQLAGRVRDDEAEKASFMPETSE